VPPNPFKSFLDVKRSEVPFVALMFTYFLLVITVFWILKPIKKALFLASYQGGHTFDLFGWSLGGPEAEQLAKVANMLVAIVATVVFSLMARKMRRQQLTLVFAAFSVLSILSFFAILRGGGGVGGAWAFYLFGDLFNTLMVPTFFAFLNDSVAPADSKRLYGPIVLGGVMGGAFGSLVVAANYKVVSVEAWLGICAALVVLIGVVAAAAGRLVDRNPPPEEAKITAEVDQKTANAAIEGARLVFHSRYLFSIFTIVILYEIVSTILDYQFTSTVDALVSSASATKEANAAAVGQHLSTVYFITNTVGLLVQLFLTPTIMSRLGVRTALLLMPIAILGNSVAFLILPVLWIGSLLNTTDNGLHYSINQSARESLYTPTSREEKYKAKAFIDMFVQRAGKAIAVGLNLALFAFFGDFSGVRWLSLFVMALLVAWILAASYAGRRFQEVTGDQPPPSSRTKATPGRVSQSRTAPSVS
jgi:AAA family ATP:ADP antiporter